MVSSDGAWQGDNPFNYALPLFIIQIVAMISLSRTLAFLLKPFGQPKVVVKTVRGHS